MPADEMWQPLLFPVGHYLGPAGESADALTGPHRLRLGERMLSLPGGDPYLIWRLAHGLPGGPAPWTAADLVRAAGLPPARFDAAVAELTGSGLLLTVDPGLPEAEQMARTYRWQSMLLGHGTQPDWAGRYAIGPAHEPWLLVNSLVHDIWRWTPIAPNLWDACEMLFEMYRDPIDGDDTAVDSPREMLSQLLPSLHLLLGAYAGHLDEAM